MRPKPARAGKRLTRAQRSRLLEIVGDVDSVEIKLTVPAGEHRATIAGLRLDPVEGEPRQVFFFDTPALELDKAGLVVRARRFPGGRGDTVVKLRPLVPARLPQSLRRSGSFKMEVDCVPGGFVCSGSLKGKSTGDAIREVAAGTLPLRRLLSREQRALFRKAAPAGLSLDALATFGPTFALRMEVRPKRLARKVVGEFWLCPDGSSVLEISAKCAPDEAFHVAEQMRDYLTRHGVVADTLQRSKTKIVLDFHARALRRTTPVRTRRSTARSA